MGVHPKACGKTQTSMIGTSQKGKLTYIVLVYVSWKHFRLYDIARRWDPWQSWGTIKTQYMSPAEEYTGIALSPPHTTCSHPPGHISQQRTKFNLLRGVTMFYRDDITPTFSVLVTGEFHIIFKKLVQFQNWIFLINKCLEINSLDCRDLLFHIFRLTLKESLNSECIHENLWCTCWLFSKYGGFIVDCGGNFSDMLSSQDNYSLRGRSSEMIWLAMALGTRYVWVRYLVQLCTLSIISC